MAELKKILKAFFVGTLIFALSVLITGVMYGCFGSNYIFAVGAVIVILLILFGYTLIREGK